MEITNEYSFHKMMGLTSEELKPVLIELRLVLESRIKRKLAELPDLNKVRNIGAKDNKYLLSRRLHKSFVTECDFLVSKLNKRGHSLSLLDDDLCFDIYAVYGCGRGDHCYGLEITFYEEEVTIIWRVDAYA